MSQIKKGAILSYLNIFITNIVGLVLTPFIVRSLGNSEYGIYSLIGAMISYFTLMDFGIGDVVIRYISRFRAKNDKLGEAEFLGFIFKIYIPITIVIFIAGGFLYFNLEYFFKERFTLEELILSKKMFLILLFNLSFSLIGNIFIGCINAYEKFTYSKGVLILKYLIRAVAIYAVLMFGGKALGLVIVDTVCNIVFFLSNFYYFSMILKLKITFVKVEKTYLKEIFSFSFWLFLMAMISQFQWQGGQLLLGIISNPEEIAIYAIGIMLGGYYGAFSSAITSMFLPHATRQVVNEVDPEILTNTMIKVGRISSYILMLIFTGFILFGDRFVILWVGKFYSEAYNIALVIMLVSTFPLVQSYANSILEAYQLVRYKTLIYLGFICLGIGMGRLGYSMFGILGVVYSICIGWLISIILLNIFYVKRLKLNMFRFYKEVFFHQFLPLVSLLGLGYVVSHIFEQLSWMNLVIMISLYAFFYCSVYYKWVLNDNERAFIKLFK